MKKAALISAFLMMILMTGCSGKAAPGQPSGGYVYHDETVLVEADEPVFLDENCFIRLSVTNTGEIPMLLCGSVGLRASDADGNDRSCQNLFAACQKAATDVPGYAPIDGLLAPSHTVTGFICVAAPDSEVKFYHISLATDYINDQWIEFDYIFDNS